MWCGLCAVSLSDQLVIIWSSVGSVAHWVSKVRDFEMKSLINLHVNVTAYRMTYKGLPGNSVIG